MKYLPLLLLSTQAYSKDYRLLELDSFSFDTYRIEDYRDYNYPYGSSDWEAGNAINFDICLLEYSSYKLYWNNTVRGNATEFQYREIAWKYDLGVAIGSKFDLLWQHESRHIMDESPIVEDRFPLSNRFVLRVNFYTREK